MKTNTAIVICAAIIVGAFILGERVYKYEQNTIVVTGLGEEEFVSGPYRLARMDSSGQPLDNRLCPA